MPPEVPPGGRSFERDRPAPDHDRAPLGAMVLHWARDSPSGMSTYRACRREIEAPRERLHHHAAFLAKLTKARNVVVNIEACRAISTRALPTLHPSSQPDVRYWDRPLTMPRYRRCRLMLLAQGRGEPIASVGWSALRAITGCEQMQQGAHKAVRLSALG